MRRLVLMRHAKSDWSDPACGDRHRPLSRRGHTDAPRMADWLAAHDLVPDAILSSPALRARQTTEHVRQALGLDLQPLWLDELYTFGNIEALAAAIREHGGHAQTLLLTGHNNAIHELARQLASEGKPKALRRLHRKFPTAALAAFELPMGAWSQFVPARGRLIHYMRPRDMRGKNAAA